MSALQTATLDNEREASKEEFSIKPSLHYKYGTEASLKWLKNIATECGCIVFKQK